MLKIGYLGIVLHLKNLYEIKFMQSKISSLEYRVCAIYSYRIFIFFFELCENIVEIMMGISFEIKVNTLLLEVVFIDND